MSSKHAASDCPANRNAVVSYALLLDSRITGNALISYKADSAKPSYHIQKNEELFNLFDMNNGFRRKNEEA